MRLESRLYRTVQAERAVRGEHEQYGCPELMKMLMQVICMTWNRGFRETRARVSRVCKVLVHIFPWVYD